MSFFMLIYGFILFAGLIWGGDQTLLLIIPGFLMIVFTHFNVQHTFRKWSEVQTSYTGAEIAQQILDDNGIHDVSIEHISGEMTDHYDPAAKVIRLSDSTHSQNSVAAIAVAAHEVGHAIQHAHAYGPLVLRNTVAPVVSFMSQTWTWLVIAGLFFSIPNLILIGIVFFAVFFLFSAITLPVEFDASKRALATLEMDGHLDAQYEMPGARKVLNAAAMTYVASAFMALMQLIRLILIFRGSDD